MATTVILEVKAKPGTGNDVVATFKSILGDTRAYDGCQGVDVYQSSDEPEVVILVEKWDSRGQYEKYLGWRQETGFVDQLVAALDGPPSIRYFELADA